MRRSPDGEGLQEDGERTEAGRQDVVEQEGPLEGGPDGALGQVLRPGAGEDDHDHSLREGAFDNRGRDVALCSRARDVFGVPGSTHYMPRRRSRGLGWEYQLERRSAPVAGRRLSIIARIEVHNTRINNSRALNGTHRYSRSLDSNPPSP